MSGQGGPGGDGAEKRIVVGVDGSDSSIAALRYGARLADALDARLEAVITWSAPPFIDYSSIAGWSPEVEASAVLDDALEQAFADTPPRGLVRTVLPGLPAATLISQSRDAEMLVLGSRGHGGFVGLMLGSVSAACAAHAQCPVLIVRGE